MASFVHPVGHATTVTEFGQPGAGRMRHGCAGMAAKAAAKSAAFAQMIREAFGFDKHPKDLDVNTVKFLPFIGTPGDPRRPVAHFQDVSRTEGPFGPIRVPEESSGGMQRGGHGHGHSMGHRVHGDFIHRINHALVSLGTWEGRAVAFVLGEYSLFCHSMSTD